MPHGDSGESCVRARRRASRTRTRAHALRLFRSHPIRGAPSPPPGPASSPARLSLSARAPSDRVAAGASAHGDFVTILLAEGPIGAREPHYVNYCQRHSEPPSPGQFTRGELGVAPQWWAMWRCVTPAWGQQTESPRLADQRERSQCTTPAVPGRRSRRAGCCPEPGYVEYWDLPLDACAASGSMKASGPSIFEPMTATTLGPAKMSSAGRTRPGTFGL